MSAKTPLAIGVVLGLGFLLLPVFLRLAGKAAWYLPAWLDRILPEVHFGHGRPGSAEVLPVEPEGDVVGHPGSAQLR